MAQLVPNPAVPPAAPPCTHPIPDALIPRLPTPNVCPTCVVEQHIFTIQDVQRKLIDRGGAFRSKENNHAQHKAIRKVWRDTKITLSNTIAKFEHFLEEGDLSVQAQDKVREALDVWERKKVVLGRVPGVLYEEGSKEIEPSDEEKERARLMMVLLKMLVEKLDKEEDVQGGATSVVPKSIRKALPAKVRKPLYRPWKISQSAEKALSALVVQTPPQPLRAAPTPPNLTPPPQEDVQPPERAVPAKPNPSLEPPAEAQQSDRAVPKTLKPTAPSSSQTGKTSPPPKSILKRPRIATPPDIPSTLPLRKRLRITEFALVSPEALCVSNPSPFQKLDTKPTVQPHAPHTTAEKHRRRAEFHRTTTPLYIPGVWASGAHSEKANTAFFKIAPAEMAEKVKQELNEEEAELFIAARFTRIVHMWKLIQFAKFRYLSYLLPLLLESEWWRGYCRFSELKPEAVKRRERREGVIRQGVDAVREEIGRLEATNGLLEEEVERHRQDVGLLGLLEEEMEGNRRDVVLLREGLERLMGERERVMREVLEWADQQRREEEERVERERREDEERRREGR
jgi:hypothetical protein